MRTLISDMHFKENRKLKLLILNKPLTRKFLIYQLGTFFYGSMYQDQSKRPEAMGKECASSSLA